MIIIIIIIIIIITIIVIMMMTIVMKVNYYYAEKFPRILWCFFLEKTSYTNFIPRKMSNNICHNYKIKYLPMSHREMTSSITYVSIAKFVFLLM